MHAQAWEQNNAWPLAGDAHVECVGSCEVAGVQRDAACMIWNEVRQDALRLDKLA